MKLYKDPYTWTGKSQGWDFDGSLNRAVHFLATRTFTDDFGNRCVYRRCGHCRCWMERTLDNFGIRERHESGHVKRWDNWCRECRRAASRRYYAEAEEQRIKMRRRARWHREMEDPEKRARRRARNAEYQRRRRLEDPQREKNTAKRYMERLRADPVRYERWLAKRREEYAVRQERKGKVVKGKKRPASAGGGHLPVAPLIAAIESYLKRTVLDMDGIGLRPHEHVGLDERTFSEWRSGKRKSAQLDLVDRALTAMGLHWWDVYEKPVNGHAKDEEAWKAYRAASLAFEGELVE